MGALSIAKTEQAIDALVDYYDPGALRRSREDAAARTVEFGSPSDVAGTTSMWARLYAPDAMLSSSGSRRWPAACVTATRAVSASGALMC